MNINEALAKEFNLNQKQIDNTLALFDDDKTIPFIARYRKELTGSLDDQILREISDRYNYLKNLQKRKNEVVSSIEEQGKLTDELFNAIENAKTLVEVEDLYRPYKPKRKTRASIARERGLEPLAQIILEQSENTVPDIEAAAFINTEKDVHDAEAALQGALDIIAEDISDDASLRKILRKYLCDHGVITSEAVNPDEESIYEKYYDFSEKVSKAAGHRILALDRGEKENFLRVSIDLPENEGVDFLIKKYVRSGGECGKLVAASCGDSYKRLIFPSIEREIRSELTEKAAFQAIKVFSSNLRQLLMQPPVKNSVTLGLDPAYRTGCKTAVVDGTGKVLDTAVIYPTPPQNKTEQAKKILGGFVAKYGVSVIAIGNGTASRETEAFVAEFIKEIPQKVSYMVVSEAGASVYSASKLAAEEFPQFDVSLRSAVSIARRLQDPLAELVKIDPKSIGVGQYQHDMPKAKLSEALSGVVESCVNNVGVDLNTASYSLLSYIAGVNKTVAKNIVAYREENGAFSDRKQLLKVPKLGQKAFEQCAGFLRVRNGKNPLDNTAVHPESYEPAMAVIRECGLDLNDISSGKALIDSGAFSNINIQKISSELNIGEPTLKDIINELKKPGRDIRDELPPPLMRSGEIMELKDIKPGMEFAGTVRNVTDFGAFVDIGVHTDGLVHISQISGKYIKHPLEAVKVGEVVKVKVLEADTRKNRISLTMKF